MTRRGLFEETTKEAVPRSDGPLERLVLVVSTASGVRVSEIPRKARFVLGRSRTCDVVVADESVSREHAAISVVGGALQVEDLGSRNTTRVMGEPLAPGATAALAVGSVLELGSVTVLLARRPGAGASPHAATNDVAVEGMVIVDPAMRKLHELVALVATATMPVLVLGETGTGKELVAEALHRRSGRAKAPVVRVNCAALAGSLLEAELFGHEKGAFTGAASARAGIFESADGGTLFLDEIGEIPLETQAKLLRVLETGEVARLGTVRTRRVDVRVVAATHRDLRAMVASGTFRADLFYRLNGFTLTIPPLRERRTEIPPLARLFARRAARGVAVELSPEAEALLVAHPWPGNVRELKFVMERATTLAGGAPILGTEHIVLDAAAVAPGAPLPGAGPASPPAGEALRGRKRDWERQQIEDALARTGGNQTEAAKILGISYRTLHNRLTALGIPKRRSR